MRTSASQYDLMVTYMEEHGDLTKPIGNACGRLQAFRRWEELVQLLNADSTGDTKPLEKWKKVWSDFKNNIKKKAAKLHQAASGTGGGPAMHARLSDLESRVLRLIGVQAATGLSGVTEAGFLQLPTPQPTPSTSVLQEAEQNTILSPTEVELHNAGPSFPPEATVEDLVDEVHTPPPPSTPRRMPTELAPSPSPSGHTPQRRRGRGTRQMSQRRSNADEAAQHFLNSDREWRKFKMDVHRDMLDLKKEKLRVRELELATQRGWQTLAKEALDLIKEYINK